MGQGSSAHHNPVRTWCENPRPPLCKNPTRTLLQYVDLTYSMLTRNRCHWKFQLETCLLCMSWWHDNSRLTLWLNLGYSQKVISTMWIRQTIFWLRRVQRGVNLQCQVRMLWCYLNLMQILHQHVTNIFSKPFVFMVMSFWVIIMLEIPSTTSLGLLSEATRFIKIYQIHMMT